MRLQRRFTHRVTIGVTAEDSGNLDVVAAALETDVSTLVRGWIKIGLANCGVPLAPRPRINGEHREVAR